MSIDWSSYTGEDKGYRSAKTGKQYVSEKTIADVWRYINKDKKYWSIDGISFTKERTYWGIDFSRILYLNGSFVKTGQYEYTIYGPFYMFDASDSSSIYDHTGGDHLSYQQDGKTVYYSFWCEENTSGFKLSISNTITYESLEAAVNNYNEYSQEVGENKGLAAWKVIYGDVQKMSIGEDMTDSEIINRLKSDTTIWNDKVTIGGNDYPYLPPLS